MEEAELNQAIERIRALNGLASISAADMITWAEHLGRHLKNEGLRTSQIRRFLGAVAKIHVGNKKQQSANFSKNDVLYLKVYLAYATARQAATEYLMRLVCPMIDKVRDGQNGVKDFEVLSRFAQAVVAYHRYYGGNE